MRILAVKGENLASHEKFEIDFTSEPLRSAGLYAITGVTGSGKSTILDAICLALYNETPRVKNAERDSIVDISNNLITLGDPRNILRRGTTSGFAQVDFIGLDSRRYSARWSVARARGRKDGKLQAPVVCLSEFDTGRVITDQKSQIKGEIERLVGLTFEQFTRTVMLAQGDFATFLKAEKKDKAELLEKLTGTDIYSKISAMIYKRAKAAHDAFNEVNAKIEGVALLDEDVLKTLLQEQGELNISREKSLEQSKRIEAKLEWINQAEKLEADRSAAELTYNLSLENEAKAEPRLVELARLDLVQGIRDDYKALHVSKSSLTKYQIELNSKNKERCDLQGTIETASKSLKSAHDVLISAEEAFAKLQPQLKKAAELDVKISEAAKPIEELQRDLLQYGTKCQKEEKELKELKELMLKSSARIQELAGWAAAHAYFAPIVPRFELISANVAKASDIMLAQERLGVQILKISQGLELAVAELAKLAQEQENLQKILPTEVVELRKKLVDGEACPVCGSKEHPIVLEEVDQMAAKALADARERVKKAIVTYEEQVSMSKEEKLRADTQQAGLSEEFEQVYSILQEDLKPLNGWEEMLKNGSLSTTLAAAVEKWLGKEKEKLSLEENLRVMSQNEGVKLEYLSEVRKTYEQRQELFKALNKEVEDIKSERLQLFEGKSVVEVENDWGERIKVARMGLEKVQNEYNLFINTEKAILGELVQLENSVKLTKLEVERLTLAVSEWVSEHSDISLEALEVLLLKTPEWVAEQRQDLLAIKDAVLSSKTRLDERVKAVLSHGRSESRPFEEETKEGLSASSKAFTEDLRSKDDRLTQIKALVINHEEGKKKIESFKEELDKARVLKVDWGKLSELFGSEKGDKFRIIAQGYTLDLLLHHANFHLRDIAPRYVLERISPESLSLQIKDMDMYAETRSVNTLSGGESFLVSLALALGLSTLSSNKMSVESLFIDEGFGSLDEETLSVAMDTLDRVQASGRKIGVISHVSEMKNRIATQIQVRKGVNGASEIVII